MNLLVSIGAVDMLTLYGGALGRLLPFALYALASAWLLILLILAFAGRAGYRWVFLAGIVLDAADMLALMLLFSIWAFGVHAFFVFRWYQGQKALKEFQETAVSAA
jgi:hypothetical protein